MKNYFNTLIQYSLKQNYINIEQARLYHINRLNKTNNKLSKNSLEYKLCYTDYLSDF